MINNMLVEMHNNDQIANLACVLGGCSSVVTFGASRLYLPLLAITSFRSGFAPSDIDPVTKDSSDEGRGCCS